MDLAWLVLLARNNITTSDGNHLTINEYSPMIIKSFIILSIVFSSIGLTGVADKFDKAIVLDWSGSKKVAEASNISIGLPDILPMPEVKQGATKPAANARHYVLADLETGKVLTQDDQHAQVPIASTTKIMTAVVALENYNLDDVATVSSAATNQIGADANLVVGEKITIDQLLHCMLIKSGNDSAYAIAEHLNGANDAGVRKFVNKMNEKAKELGMKDTNYHDPAGLDVTGYSSANDLLIITRYALGKEPFADIVKLSNYSAKSVDGKIWHALDNSNRLVNQYQYPGAIGVKTGYMPESGHCLVGAAKRDGHGLVAIVLNTYLDSPSASADEAKRLLDWGFTNIEWN